MKARSPAEYRDVHEAADAREPRAARAFVRSVEKARSTVSINDLAAALAAKDRKAAERLLAEASGKDPLTPLAGILEDAFMKGGKLGAVRVNAVRREP
jgi:hypothetical protein